MLVDLINSSTTFKMNNSVGSWDRRSAENRTRCEHGLLKLMSKKYFEIHGVNTNSTLDEYDAKIDKTDIIAIVDDFIKDCNDNEYKHEFLYKMAYYVYRVIIPSFLGVGAILNLLVIIFFLQM